MKYTYLVFLILPMFIFSQKRYSSDQVYFDYPGEDYLYDDEWVEITGIVYQKYEIGHLRYEHEYKNASRDGLSKGWYVNGKLKYIENYQEGAYHGWVKKWPMDHSDSSLVLYEDGEIVNGTEKEWFHNKTLIKEIKYKEGQYHGFYKKWHENGKQSYQCKYTQGGKSGEEIKWNDAGDVIFKANYKDGKLNGKLKRWSPDLKESCEVYYKDGIPWNGIEKDWYRSNQLQYENIYKEGKQDGKQTAFLKDGEIKYEINYKNGELHGISKGYSLKMYYYEYEEDMEYYDPGYDDIGYYDMMYYPVLFDSYEIEGYKEEHFKNGKLDGLSKYVFQGDVMSECYYKDGLKDGLCIENSYMGRIIEKIETNYVKGKKEGSYKQYAIDELESLYLCAEGNYSNNQKVGNWKNWHSNGQLFNDVTYIKGLKEGVEKGWFENGNVKAEAEYENGTEIGTSKRWYIDGQLEYEKNSISKSMKTWYKNGQLKQMKYNFLLPPPNSIERNMTKEWCDNGQLKYVMIYENGLLLHEKWWWENGILKAERKYQDKECVTNNNWSSSGQSTFGTPSKPNLSSGKIYFFEGRYRKFGDVAAGSKNKHSFVFKNNNTFPVVISKVNASCGCTVPVWNKTPIMPGEIGNIEVIYEPKISQAGSYQKKSIKVTFDVESYSKTKVEILYVEANVKP